MTSQLPQFGVSECIAAVNQTFEYAYPLVEVVGEVASFKVNQGKFVFFDLKDEAGSLGCFMMTWQLRTPIEDGMRVVVTATPKLTQWGKFSLTVRSVRPEGEGALRKSFELLRAKLQAEGLFDQERKRPLPVIPHRVAVISSTQAAGYQDFIKIVDERWGGLQIETAHVQVQGDTAATQMIRALEYFNQKTELPDVIVLVRGGGSADDLSAYNDESLVRAIAASRAVTLVGVGHEQDESLVDMVADVRASTPSHAAQLLVSDRREILQQVQHGVQRMLPRLRQGIAMQEQQIAFELQRALDLTMQQIDRAEDRLAHCKELLLAYDPKAVLGRGYALVRGEQRVGGHIQVETKAAILTAKVETYEQK